MLKPWKDPAALRALETYRDHCYPELATDISGWIHTIASGAKVRGGVGARNEAHVASRPKARPAAKPKAKAKAAPKKKARKSPKKKGDRR